jgi:hypothetical protein
VLQGVREEAGEQTYGIILIIFFPIRKVVPGGRKLYIVGVAGYN